MVSAQAKRHARRIRHLFADELATLRRSERDATERLRDRAKKLKEIRSDHIEQYSDSDLDRADLAVRHAETDRCAIQARIELVERLHRGVAKILDGGKA